MTAHASTPDSWPRGQAWPALFEQARLAVLGLDSEDRVVYASPLLLRLIGDGLDEVLGRNWFDQFVPDEHHASFRCFLRDASAAGEVRRHRADVLTKHGELRLVEWSTCPAIDSDVFGVTFAVGEDLTEQYEARARAHAAAEVARTIVEGQDAREVLRIIADGARELARSDLATIALPDPDLSWLCLAVASGLGADLLEGTRFPRQGSISGAVIEDRSAVILDDVSTDVRRRQPVVAFSELGPAMFLPLSAPSQVFGTLLVANRRGRRRFTAHDLELVQTFADQAAVAFQFSRAQEQLRQLGVVQDGERRARDLHDTVIQRLFATGIMLQTALGQGGPPEMIHRVEQAITDLDDTITAIRSTIFPLDRSSRSAPTNEA